MRDSGKVTVELDNGELKVVGAAYAAQKGLTVVDDPSESPLSADERATLHKAENRGFVRVKLENGTEATVGAVFAKVKGLTVLDKPADNKAGRPLPPKPKVDLAGKALDKALTDAGLPTTGKADEKRQRLADFTNNTEVSS